MLLTSFYHLPQMLLLQKDISTSLLLLICIVLLLFPSHLLHNANRYSYTIWPFNTFQCFRSINTILRNTCVWRLSTFQGYLIMIIDSTMSQENTNLSLELTLLPFQLHSHTSTTKSRNIPIEHFENTLPTCSLVQLDHSQLQLFTNDTSCCIATRHLPTDWFQNNDYLLKLSTYGF
jgi:hypothetical protein